MMALNEFRNPAKWKEWIRRTQRLGSFVVGETRARVLRSRDLNQTGADDIDSEIARQIEKQIDIWSSETVHAKSANETSRLVEVVTQKTLFELDAAFSRIAPEVVADMQWAREQLSSSGFAAEKGDYVAVLNQNIVGSGDSEEALRCELAEKFNVPSGRFIVEYKGSWD